MNRLLGIIELLFAFAIALVAQRYAHPEVARATAGCLIAILLSVMVMRAINVIKEKS